MATTKGDCPTCGDQGQHPVRTGTGKPLTERGVPLSCPKDGTDYEKR